MVVWDFDRDTVAYRCMVSHGCGKQSWSGDFSKDNPCLSNTDDSHCTSVGKYKIGKRGYSNWGIGINYMLHGMDSTNSNAQKRQIVLHSWEAVPDKAVYPKGTPEGWGCPAIANRAMRHIDQLLQKQQKPTLLWIIK